VRLVADQNLSFELPISEAFQAYAHALREEAGADLPSSSTTVRTWIVNAYQTQKDRMIEVLHAAPHLVHITADTLEAVEGLKSFNRRRRL
jgi:uracil phosphoribosyltransferase